MKNLNDIIPKKKITSGDVIKSFRDNFKVSQNQLCEAIDISQTNLSAIENNRRKLGIDVAMKLSIFFGVDPIALLYPNGIDKEVDNYKKIRRNAEKLASA
jgi:putative transcriptional regulator